jgi:hypothetical protein
MTIANALIETKMSALARLSKEVEVHEQWIPRQALEQSAFCQTI